MTNQRADRECGRGNASGLGAGLSSGVGRVGRIEVVVKGRVDAARGVRGGILELAERVAGDASVFGCLVLRSSKVTEGRVREEWERAGLVLRPELVARMVVCVEHGGMTHGLTRDMSEEERGAVAVVMRRMTEGFGDGQERDGRARGVRPDFSFVVLKVLLHQFLLVRRPVTMDWICRTSGCTYPTAARVVKGLGSLVERGSDRRVALRYFPQEEYERLVATSVRARSTVRYVDRSGQLRLPESRVRRMEKLGVEGVAIGGVLGARHFYPELDLVGTPRLDVSVRGSGDRVEASFVRELDPALEREEDVQKPVSVVVHRVWHADAMFRERAEGLAWADPLECLLDLREMGLASQAAEFLEAMKAGRVGLNER